MFTELRLKIRKFYRKYKKVILIALVIWAIIFVINLILKNMKQPEVLNTTYTPHSEVIRSDSQVPKKLYKPIEDTFDEYVLQCNLKNYEEAYKLIADDCKQRVFDNSIDEFKKYVDSLFNKKKRYSIQDYSNYGNYYIYNLKLIDDIITTGLTNQEYAFYEEKVAVRQNGDKLELFVDNYMGYDDLKRVAEDDNLKIRIETRIKFYSYEIYTIRITNKTDKHIVLYDSIVGDEIYMEIGEENRIPSNVDRTMWLIPGETKTFQLTFNKYYDEKAEVSNMIFNKIRIMDEYTGEETTEEEETSKASKLYSISVPLN